MDAYEPTTLIYKGYRAFYEYDEEAQLFHGNVLNIRDIITFQSESEEKLQKEFEFSVEDYLEFCAKRGKQPERPVEAWR